MAPNPTIMSHAIKNKKFAHKQAAERLIVKLFVNENLTGNSWEAEKARLITSFTRSLVTSQGDVAGSIDHIFGLLQLILLNRPFIGIKNILFTVLKYWASLHV